MKKLFVFTGFVFISLSCFSQGDEFYGNYQHFFEQSDIIENPTVQPPDVATFQKVNFLPVNNYTGRANINVPIYEVKSGNISLPISISYNSSGVKVNDRGSNVGMNWSLNAGGVISKIVKGMEDFSSYDSENLTDIDEYTVSPVGWLYPKHIGLPYSNQSYGDNNDHLPDLFIVTAPGLNTQYMHDRSIHSMLGNHTPISGTGNVFELTGQNNKIEETYGTPVVGKFNVLRQISGSNDWEYYDGSFNSQATLRCFEKIKITSTSGTIYEFNHFDVSQYSRFSERDPGDTGIQSLWNQWKTERKVESYRLSIMKDVKTNKEIQFQYESYNLDFYDPIDNYSYTVGDYEGPSSTESYSTKYPKLNRLTKILFDTGSVEFSYELNREDILGEKALTKIEVKNLSGQTIKTVNLEYSYFQTSGSSTPQGKRLRLDRVQTISNTGKTLPPYEFTYNSTELPERGSWGQDFLGYNNGTSGVTDPKPNLYFYPDKGIHSSLPFYAGSGYHLLSGNYSLASNVSYSKSGILEKIKHPTGGFTEIEYELNQFMINNFEVYGGGLRVKSQKIVDEYQNEQILDYAYDEASGLTSGRIVSLPKYNELYVKDGLSSYPSSFNANQTMTYMGFKIYRVSRSQAELTNNSFVGYSVVKVKNRIENGYMTYDYSSPIQFPFKLANQQAFSGGWLGSIHGNSIDDSRANLSISNGKYSISQDRDVFRGKLLDFKIYDKYNNLLEETVNQFSYKKFDSIPIAYDIKLCNGGNGCYDGYGGYDAHGILETSSILSERYLLTSSQKTQYLNPGNLIESKLISYNSNTPQVIKNVFTNSDNKTYETHFTYSNRSDLLSQNRINELEKKQIKNGQGTSIFVQNYSYMDFGGGIIDLVELSTQKGTSISTTRAVIHKRDNNGNILEFSNGQGPRTVLIWGHNNCKLVAKIENASYNEIESLSYFGTGFTLGSLGLSSNQSSQLRSSLSQAQVTSYSYDLLVGVTSITDSKGMVTYYSYDDYGRLMYVKDQDNKVLSKNEYHYKSQ